MEKTAWKSEETLREGGFRIEVHPGELIVTRDPSAWNPRMRRSRHWQIAVAIGVAIIIVVNLTKSPSELVPPVSFPILLGILLFFLWPLGVNNIQCTREHIEVIRLHRGIEIGRWLFPRSLVERVHIEQAFGRSEMGFTIAFTVNGNTVQTLRGIRLDEAQVVLLQLRDLGFDVGVGGSDCKE
jgi:hypothetical protein